MLYRWTILCVVTWLLGAIPLSANFSMRADNTITVNGIDFDLNLIGDKRISENTYSPLSFDVSRENYADSIRIVYSAPELDITLCLSARNELGVPARLAQARAHFKQEVYLHELYFSMDGNPDPIICSLKGVRAIESGDHGKNINLIPFTDKMAEYSVAGIGKFWIVASNYAECEGVEVLSANRIVLYDYKGHFFRVMNAATNQTDLLRDTMYRRAGDTHLWSFLIFSEKPYLLDINRWPQGKLAALSITNDADAETLQRLSAVFFGSNNPASPKYLTQGFFARNIPTSNTVFGVNQPVLGDIWHEIKNRGNCIGYHTYDNYADPPGSNLQALLNDLLPYNIRMWIDHGVPTNPEDIAFSGLDPDSPHYIADIINQSSIDYIWPGDTPPTSPFNAYDESWRLPHIVYEAKDFTRPIWFYGRTRMEAWEYVNGWSMLSMKYLMTPDNLDQLIADRGLHLCYTHFCFNNSSAVRSFFIIADNGDYEIRPEVDEMLLMLDYYREHRGLWIETAENIFDRMLATEQVKVIAVSDSELPGFKMITLHNLSSQDIPDFSFKYEDQEISAGVFSAGTVRSFYISGDPDHSLVPTPSQYQVIYRNSALYIKEVDSSMTAAADIYIYNIRGQKVVSFKAGQAAPTHIVPFAGKASGIYFARIIGSNSRERTERFFVTK